MTAENNTPVINWVTVQRGRLALGHRPKKKVLWQLSALGATHVLTLLSENEGAEAIGTEVRRAGLHWLWLPMTSADPPTEERTPDVRNCFEQMKLGITDGGSLLIHCSAGIHRTGMIAYAFLRFSGYSAEQASQILKQLRSHTFEGVGNHRIEWGERLIASL